jgi:hypothetical protein
MLVAFVEVAAFAQITHPAKWFIFMFVFFAVSFVLYAWDVKMIRERREEFQDTPARARLYDHIYGRQAMELRVLLPGALVFHGAIVVVLWQSPGLILDNDRHVFVVTAQIISGLVYLVGTIGSFTVRQRLMADCVEDEAG